MKYFFIMILSGLIISQVIDARSLDIHYEIDIEAKSTGAENISYDNKRTQFLSARRSLKDYGLIACLIDIDKNQSKLRDDLKILLSQYTNDVNRKYLTPTKIKNNTRIKDPYEAVHDYMTQNKGTYTSRVLEIGEVKTGGCFQVYHSAAYAYFIENQDKYMNFL